MLVALALSLQLALAPSAAPDAPSDTVAFDGPVSGWHADDPARLAWPDAAAVSPDSVPTAGPLVIATRIGLAPAPLADSAIAGRRVAAPPAVEHSDWYYRRLGWHRALSWAMVPLFIGSYVTGDRLLDGSTNDPAWVRRTHPLFATGSAVVFGANAVTGIWNLVEGWKEKQGRTKRLLHTAAMTVASAGFVYAGSLGDRARDDRDVRTRHRSVAIGSMGISTASWLFMLLGR